MDLVPYAVPFFLGAILLEFAWGRWRGNNTYRLNDTINSLSLGVLSTATKLLGLNLASPVFAAVATHFAPFRLDPSSVWTWLFALLLFDFCYYWFHRISHERALFWASHVVHHQSEEYNLSTALRQTSTGFLVAWVFYIPCFLLGIPAEIFVTVGSAHLIYQFWIHSRHIPKLGVLEWFLVTASNHRVHHARNPGYVDTNYGGLLIVWDRVFGTFAEEKDEEPCVYGITTQLRSWNPVWANLHIYRDMCVDAAAAGSLRGALRVLGARTGWHPERSPLAHKARRPFDPYDPATPPATRWYVGVQFLCAVVFSLWFEHVAGELGAGVKWLTFACLVTWLAALGALLERSPQARRIEGVRIVMLVGVFTASGASVPVLMWMLAYACISGAWLRSLRPGLGVKAESSPGAASHLTPEKSR